MTAMALGTIAGGMALVRLGWSGRRAVALAGWALAGVALFSLAMRDGAWGLAIGTLAGTAMIALLLGHAGWTAPARRQRPEREVPSVVLPHRWRDFGRRITVFVLVVPVGFAAAQGFAFAAQALARSLGAGESDTIVLTLILQPVVWTGIMTVQLTRDGPLRMIAAPVIVTVTGLALCGLA